MTLDSGTKILLPATGSLALRPHTAAGLRSRRTVTGGDPADNFKLNLPQLRLGKPRPGSLSLRLTPNQSSS